MTAGNLIRERDGSTVPASYIHGLDLSTSLQGAGEIGGILARIDHATVLCHAYLFDANGNATQLINSADGGIDSHYEYTPFGRLIMIAGPFAEKNPFRFSSKYLDNESGLVYYGYKYYSPELAPWITRDPFEEEGGSNLYAYVQNDPVNLVDYLGNYTLGDAKTSSCEDKCANAAGLFKSFCLDKCYNNLVDKEIFAEWLMLEKKDKSWFNDLPDCPCKKECLDDTEWGPPTSNLYGYHEGATECVRSKPVGGHANQCCYDSSGNLITHGSGSGSADYSPGSVMTFLKHKWHDMDPADLALELDGGEWGSFSEKYLEVRPQVGGGKCPKNP